MSDHERDDIPTNDTAREPASHETTVRQDYDERALATQTTVGEDTKHPAWPRIVVGLDRSEAARCALGWACRYAELLDAHIAVVAVSQLPTLQGELPGIDAEQLVGDTRQWARDTVATLPAAYADRIRTCVQVGLPDQVLLDHAQHAELLVLGNHGRGALAGALLGSVALRCAHHAPCPVVLVPAPPDTSDTSDTAG
jgi:nucleotide-binding universal stress UspA family protein